MDWKELVIQAVDENSKGDEARLNLLVQLITECEEAKQELRKKGYGVTGQGILKTVHEVPEANAF
jgi:hypothetical protein